MNSEKRCMNNAKILQKKEHKSMIGKKKKKGDEQFILNKPKVLQLLHIHPTSVTTFS